MIQTKNQRDAALYERLSREDGDRLESDSIVNQQRIVVTTHKGETHVAVYDSTDNQLLKTRETVFANLQEVERAYVTSRFPPPTYTTAAALPPILPTV